MANPLSSATVPQAPDVQTVSFSARTQGGDHTTTNNTNYLLLASSDVSIFFDNSFVTNTRLTSVFPGESFQMFLGVDPTVRTKVAPPRKTHRKTDLFGKAEQTIHAHSTSVSNKKTVPGTCIIVDRIPRSISDSVNVSLQTPLKAQVRDVVAPNDEDLVASALELSGGGGERDSARAVKTAILGMAKNDCEHLAWVVKIAPQDDSDSSRVHGGLAKQLQHSPLRVFLTEVNPMHCGNDYL